MAQEKVLYNEQQRVDLPDFEKVINSSEVELRRTLNSLFALNKGVIKGFEFVAGSGLKAQMDKSSTRIALDADGLLLIDEEVGVPLELDLVASSDNYIELTFAHEDSDFELRPFYDIDAKEEFSKEVFTRKRLVVTISANQSSFSTNAIPLAVATTDASSVTGIVDSREILFSAKEHVWGGTRTDKTIENLKEYIDMVASIFKEAKGTATYFDAPATTLQRTMDLSIAVIEGKSNATFDHTTGDLVCPAFNLLMPNKTFDYVVDAISETLADKEMLYVEIPIETDGNFKAPAGNLTVTKCTSSTFPNDSKNFLICSRVGNEILFNKGSIKVPDFLADDLDSKTIVSAINDVDQRVRTNSSNISGLQTASSQNSDDIKSNLDSPLKLSETATPDTKLNFSLSPTTLSDGAKRALPPLSSQVFEMVASTIDFQTQATTGETFDIEWPTTNVVDKYRRVGFTLLSGQTIKAIFSEEADDIASLENAGAFFVSNGLALGYIDLKCTHVDGKWKTANSATDIIENGDIYRFGSGSGGGSGTGDLTRLEANYNIILSHSIYDLLSVIDFSKDRDTKSGPSTTASINITATPLSYGFLTGQIFESVDLLDPTYTGDLAQVDIGVNWDISKVDDSATYEITRDGGNTWETLVLSRENSSDSYFGTHIFTQEISNPLELKIRITAGTDDVAIEGIGVFYDVQPSTSGAEPLRTKRFVINTEDNVTEFELGDVFIPDSDLLTCFIPEVGQVFKVVLGGVMQISGTKAVFTDETFYDLPNRSLTLIFDQNTGSKFDMNEDNGAIISDNHLGSESASLDRSVAGRGTKTKNSNGDKREITLDENDNISIKDLPSLNVIKKINQVNNNLIINGSFNVSQRNDLSTPIAASDADYNIDRWKNSTFSIPSTIQQVDASEIGFLKALLYTCTSSLSGMLGAVQLIEDYSYFYGKNVTLSAYIKSNSSNARIGIHDGVSWVALSDPHSGNGQYERLTVTGNVSELATQLAVIIRIMGSSGGVGTVLSVTSGDFITIAGVKLEIGELVTPFVPRLFSEELSLCQRYFVKTYEQHIFPGQVSFASNFKCRALGTSSYAIYWNWKFPVAMRNIPTCKFYSTATGAESKIRNESAGVDIDGVLTNAGQNGVNLGTNATLAIGNFCSAHMTADAEIS